MNVINHSEELESYITRKGSTLNLCNFGNNTANTISCSILISANNTNQNNCVSKFDLIDPLIINNIDNNNSETPYNANRFIFHDNQPHTSNDRKFLGKQKAVSILIENNCKMNLTGLDMPFSECIIGSEAAFTFMHKDKQISIITPIWTEPFESKNFDKLLKVCDFLSNQKFAESGFQLALNYSHALRFYNINKKVADIILKQIGVNINSVKSYLNSHFLEIIAICKINKDGLGNFKFLPKYVIGEIFSYLELDDFNNIKTSGDTLVDYDTI